MSTTNTPIKTGIYIDGYNLYYGRLRGTPYKWLDVMRLFHALLMKRSQNEAIEKLHIFTAPALANFATHGRASVLAQADYYRALNTLYGDRLEVIYGNHAYDKKGALLPMFVAGQPYDRTNRIRVWKLEEKKTDVNLALRMYRDASRQLYDRIILVSNDSDVEPALQAIREDFPHIMIGVIMPIKPINSGLKYRSVSGSLSNIADWVHHDIADSELQEAQLPDKIPTRKKPIRKPEHW